MAGIAASVPHYGTEYAATTTLPDALLLRVHEWYIL